MATRIRPRAMTLVGENYAIWHGALKDVVYQKHLIFIKRWTLLSNIAEAGTAMIICYSSS